VTRLRRLMDLRFRRIDWPFPALELTNDAGDGWLICRLPNPRTETDR
jgi:hypothetical protein